jgi:hypothetical protein
MEHVYPISPDQIRITALEKQVKELLAALASQQKQIDFLLNNLSVGTTLGNPSLGNPSLGKHNLSRFRIALIMVANSTIDTGLYSEPIAQFLREHIPQCEFEVAVIYVTTSANNNKEIVMAKSLEKLKGGSYDMGLILNFKTSRADPHVEVLEQIRNSGSIPHVIWLFIEPTNSTAQSPQQIGTHFGGGIFVGQPEALQTSLVLYTSFEMKGATPRVHVIDQNLKNVQFLSRMVKMVQELS